MAESFCPHCMKTVNPADTFCAWCGLDVHVESASYHLPIGTVLRTHHGKSYLFGKVKGEGGFGMTYIAKEMQSGEVVAIKEYYPLRCQPQRDASGAVHPMTSMEEIYTQGKHSFLSEASMLSAISGIPSIVQVRDYFETNGTAYMVMEYLSGSTLSELMKIQNHFEPTLLMQKMLPLMRDIERIHEAGVLHRDIAPDNIMLMPDGSLKLLDFGCARSIEDGKSMTVVLKPGFAPIEQYQTRGQKAYTDIYALMATIYYCLTGYIPPAAPERLMCTVDGKPDLLVPPGELHILLDPQIERILMWGLTLQPAGRPQTMTQVADALVQAMQAMETVQTKPNLQSPEPKGFSAWIRKWKQKLFG